tara:strand:- start:855 stop:1235 length:381 start_codon:yes stop_codon:yes gene_type:complete
MKKISYSAVVLTEDSHAKLVNKYGHLIPEGWKFFAHHMTIVFGKGLPNEVKQQEGDTVELKVTHIGLNKRVVAFKVDGFPSANEVPHITFAVNVTEGAKPVESNDISEWVDIVPFNVEGVVTEIPK